MTSAGQKLRVPRHTSPLRTLSARQMMLSTPARFRTVRRTVNEPLGARVVRVPFADTEPLCTMRQVQDWPTRLLLTWPSTSRRPSSGPTFSFQLLVPLHELERIWSVPFACAGAETATQDAAATRMAALVLRLSFMVLPPDSGWSVMGQACCGGEGSRYCPVVLALPGWGYESVIGSAGRRWSCRRACPPTPVARPAVPARGSAPRVPCSL